MPRIQHAWARALVDLGRGELDAARVAARRAIDRSPDASTRATAQAILAMADAEAGEASNAIPLLEEAVQQLARFPQRQSTVMVFLGEAYRLDGRGRDARVAAKRALVVSREIALTWATASAERTLGRIAFAEGDRGAAARHLDAALALFAAIPAHFELGRTHLDRALLAHTETDGRDQTARHLNAAHRLFTAARAPRYTERAERLSADLGIASRG